MIKRLISSSTDCRDYKKIHTGSVEFGDSESSFSDCYEVFDEFANTKLNFNTTSFEKHLVV